MKDIFRLGLLVIFLTNPFALRAQNWIFVGKNEKGEKTYVNKKDIVNVSNNVKRVWIKYSSQNYKLYKNGKTQIIPLITYTYLTELNCLNKYSKNITLIVRDQNGKIIFNETRKEEEQAIEYMVPGTIGAAILNYVCGNL